MTTNGEARIVFAEKDTLFHLMEVAVHRGLTPGGEMALRYFFGSDFSDALELLTGMADRLGLPLSMEAVVCSDEATLDEVLPNADFLVVERAPITRSRLQAGANHLRLVQKFGRDCRNIDLHAASDMGIKVANLTRISSMSSADNVMALLLALARNLLPAHESVRSRRDSKLQAHFETGPVRTKFNWSSIHGIRLLAEHTLGLIGLGENSGEVAKRAIAFGMRVTYFKRHRLSPEEEAALGGVEFRPLDELLAHADFLSIHVPYNAQTEKMVNREFLSKMKSTAFLINTSRGGIVDEQALYQALESGRIAGAALDVYRYEPVPPDCPLLDLTNVIWTPHMSGGEPEFMLREVEDVLSNLARVWHGDMPKGLLTL